jgi:hypothetical protein
MNSRIYPCPHERCGGSIQIGEGYVRNILASNADNKGPASTTCVACNKGVFFYTASTGDELEARATGPVNKLKIAHSITSLFEHAIREAINQRVHVELKTIVEDGRLARYELQACHKATPGGENSKDTYVLLMNVPYYREDVQ